MKPKDPKQPPNLPPLSEGRQATLRLFRERRNPKRRKPSVKPRGYAPPEEKTHQGLRGLPPGSKLKQIVSPPKLASGKPPQKDNSSTATATLSKDGVSVSTPDQTSTLDCAPEAQPDSAPTETQKDAGNFDGQKKENNDYGANNKLVTRARADEIRAKLKAKLNQRRNPQMSLLYAQHILKPETVTAILELDWKKAEQIADRWAMGWPKRTRELEKEGTLLDALRNQAERESRAIREETRNGTRNLADHEIAELWGLTPEPP